ncbi:hypothetical protein MVEN_00196800 [Mycena venus]|uniref:Uncharacterized protein n=1 Tax=Mycena venus TaxID=2733690 RepID=A0A8H6Z2K5_9AGAR|nr:hypothetical protein MVEN_00196800 [Mycena venus]
MDASKFINERQLMPILFWTLSLIPMNVFRYIVVGAGFTSILIYGVYHNCPSARLDRLNNAITDLEGTLTHAKAKCMRDYTTLVDSETRFLCAKLSASRLHSRLLRMHDMSWKIYLSNLRETLRTLAICEREVRELQIFVLLLIEASDQRKLAEDINQNLEIVDSISHSLSGCTRVYHLTSSPDCEV